MTRRTERLIAATLLPVFGILVAFAAVEVGVRLLHLVPDRFWEPDPLLGSRLIAGREGWWTQEEREFKVRVRINSDGMRDVERQRAKAVGVYRILVLGDSFMEAMQVPLEDAFSRQLERRLNAASGGRKIEVLNAGVSGYGTAGEYLWLRERGQELRPDLVLVAFYPGNDVKNNSPELESTLRPEYGPDGLPTRIVGPQPRRSGLFGWSAAVRFLRRTLMVGHGGLAEPLGRWGFLDPTAGQVTKQDGIPVDYGVYRKEEAPPWTSAWQKTSLLLAGLHDVAMQQGALSMVVIVTSRERIYPESWKAVSEANPKMNSVEWDLERPERRVVDWCRSAGVPCVSLTDSFLAERDKGEPLHYRHDGHWTSRGHALAAELTANALSKEMIR